MKKMFKVKNIVMNYGREALIRIPQQILDENDVKFVAYMRTYVFDHIHIDYEYYEMQTAGIKFDYASDVKCLLDYELKEQAYDDFVDMMYELYPPEDIIVIIDTDDLKNYDFLQHEHERIEQLIYEQLTEMMAFDFNDLRIADEHDKYINSLDQMKTRFDYHTQQYLNSIDIQDSNDITNLEEQYAVTIKFGQHEFNIGINAAVANGITYLIEHIIEEQA